MAEEVNGPLSHKARAGKCCYRPIQNLKTAGAAMTQTPYTVRDTINLIAGGIVVVLLAAALVTALDYIFRPTPDPMDPLAPHTFSETFK
jgi:hypothetical protein